MGTELGGNRKQIGNRLSQRLNNVPYTEVVSLILQNPAPPCCLKQKLVFKALICFDMFRLDLNSTNIRQIYAESIVSRKFEMNFLNSCPKTCWVPISRDFQDDDDDEYVNDGDQ